MFILTAALACFICIFFFKNEILIEHSKRDATKDVNTSGAEKITYGIAAGSGLTSKTDDQINKMFKSMKDVGFTRVRFDMMWDIVQPRNKDQYDWSAFDRIIKLSHENGVEPQVILNRTPQWARKSTCTNSVFCPPVNQELFANYSREAIKRYGNKVIAWEIWNEPNTYVFWKPNPDVGEYVGILKAAYAAIKSQNPNAVVLLGGLGGSTGDGGKNHIDSRTFLKRVYELGGKDYFDALAFHPYTNLKMPTVVDSNNGWSKIESLNPSIRSIMSQYNDSDKKIWLNEVGIPTEGPKGEYADIAEIPKSSMDHVSEAIQAEFATQILTEIKNMPYVSNLSWYSYIDGGTSKNTTENFYGIETVIERKKPALEVFKSMLK